MLQDIYGFILSEYKNVILTLLLTSVKNAYCVVCLAHLITSSDLVVTMFYFPITIKSTKKNLNVSLNLQLDRPAIVNQIGT